MKKEEIEEILNNELEEVLKELNEIAVVDKNSACGYTAKETNTHAGDVLDLEDQAAEFENLNTNIAVLDVLGERKIEIEQTLKRIEGNQYGKCSKCKKEIEKKRLKINLTADTCIEHMEV